VEKFLKNYLDCGHIIRQKSSENSDKMLQELRYMDLSTWRGEVFQDEETRFIYKEGTG